MAHSKPWFAVLGAYVCGLLLGLLAAEDMAHRLVARPHQLPALEIIQHNLLVLVIMFLGILTVGTVTLLVLLINGIMLGAVVGAYAWRGKLIAVLLALAPHGILEIGAFLLAAYGDLLLVPLFWNFLRTGRWRSWYEHRQMLWRALHLNSCAVALLICAGLIEHTLFLTVS
jgi:uncharacterized membrane protein SpoIIM required for sporulation